MAEVICFSVKAMVLADTSRFVISPLGRSPLSSFLICSENILTCSRDLSHRAGFFGLPVEKRSLGQMPECLPRRIVRRSFLHNGSKFSVDPVQIRIGSPTPTLLNKSSVLSMNDSQLAFFKFMCDRHTDFHFATVLWIEIIISKLY